jgi:hypothetical protein
MNKDALGITVLLVVMMLASLLAFKSGKIIGINKFKVIQIEGKREIFRCDWSTARVLPDMVDFEYQRCTSIANFYINLPNQ